MFGRTIYDTEIVGHELRRKQVIPALKPGSKVEFKGRFAYQDHIVFGDIFNARYASINTPTGSGKTYMILAHTSNHLNANLVKRVIIMTPQRIPATGFKEERYYFRENGDAIGKIGPGLNLVDDIGTENSKCKTLVKFMSPTVNKLLKDNIALCTHLTFVNAYKLDPDAFRDCLLVVDEAHHSSDAEGKLGEIVNDALTDVHKNLHLLMVSATMYRPNGSLLYKPEFRPYFKTAFRSFHDHLVSVDIHNVRQEIILTPDDAFEKPLSEIIADRSHIPVIYLPGDAVNDKKLKYLNRVYKCIGSVRRKIAVTINGYKTYVQRFTHADGIVEDWIELVDDNVSALRDAKKYLIEAINNGQYNIRGIISNRMFGEGGDLRPLNCVVQIGFNNSLQRAQQRNGRATRFMEGKNSVAFFTIVSGQIKGQENQIELNNKINDIHKIMAYAQMTQDLMQPIDLVIKKAPKEIADEIKDAVERGPGLLERIFDGNREKEATFRVQVQQECMATEAKVTLDTIREAVKVVASNTNGMKDLSPKDLKAVAMGIWLRQVINRLKYIEPHLDMSKITYQMAQAVDCGDDIQRHFADLTGKTYRELQKKVRKFDWNECEKTIQQIAALKAKIPDWTPHGLKNQDEKSKSQSKSLSQWIQNKKAAKMGRGTLKWYGFEDELAQKYGLRGLFDLIPREQIAYDKCIMHCESISLNPRKQNTWVSTIRKAYKSHVDGIKNNSIAWYSWYPDVFAQYGLAGLHMPDFVKKYEKSRAEKDVTRFLQEYKITRPIGNSVDYDRIKNIIRGFPDLGKILEDAGLGSIRNSVNEQNHWDYAKKIVKFKKDFECLPPSNEKSYQWLRQFLRSDKGKPAYIRFPKVYEFLVKENVI